MEKNIKKSKHSSDEDYITLDFGKLPLPWAILLSTIIFTAGVSSAIYFGLKGQSQTVVSADPTTEETLVPTEPPLPTLGDNEFESVTKLIQNLPGRGDTNSGVIVIEFGEYSCSACQAYHSSYFPSLDEGYIKEGFARMYYADVPRVPTYELAQHYGMCLNEIYGEDAFFKYHDEVFSNTASYLGASVDEKAIKDYINNKLKKDAKKVQSCTDGSDISDQIEENRSMLVTLSGEAWATPTFFVGKVKNGNVISGEVTVGAGPGTLEVLVENYLSL